MKKRSLLLGLIFLISALTVHGQIVTKYQQGFEATGESCGYTVTQGSANVVTNVASSGERALKMNYSTSGMVEITLDTIDFTDNGQFMFFYLEFMHICDVDPLTAADAAEVATIEVRRAEDPNSQWSPLDGNDDYDATWGGGSSDFSSNSSFSERSYNIWRGTTPNNTWWKRERFKLATYVQGASSIQYRKLLIRFRLYQKNTAGASSEGWYLDNIKVQCSPISMLLPVLTMTDYPDLMNYPNSRGTHVSGKFVTPLTEGMCNDSVYVVYQLGRSADIMRKTTTPVAGSPGEYEAYIPFCGYDTIVRWRLIGKDNTANHNLASFPSDLSGWNEYKSVRGKASTTPIGTSSAPSLSLPFPNQGLFKCEMVYDSSEMSAHYAPAAITQIRFPVAANVTNSNRNRFMVKMRNIDNTFAYTSSSIQSNTTNEFNSEYQKIVYDSSLSITQNASTNGIINLQDTFFYAGKGLMITFISQNNNNDPSAVSVRTFPAPASNNSTRGSVVTGYPTSVGFDPFTSAYFQSGSRVTARPNFSFQAVPNAPLLYDCGISGFINPNDTTPANAVGDNNVVVTLKNYGSEPITNVRIYYSVDNGAHQYFDFVGNLAGGATTNVTINTTQQYAAGYHEMLAWVDDSVTSGGMRYRDHEPFNDTLWTRFISCDGPMSGVRQVGGSTPDYANLDNLLYALSQCGVNGPLIVKLSPGYYTPKTFPVIEGVSATNYIQFEPLSTGNVVFVSAMGDAPLVNSLVNLQQTNHIRFKNIDFLSNSQSNPATYLVRMGTNSTGCQFIDCSFSEVQGGSLAESYMAASALLYSGGADSLLVQGCTFNRGTAGLSLVGPAQDNMARGSQVLGNSFSHQSVNSAIIRNQIDAIVDSNSCDDLYANSSYAILLQDCSGATKVTRNTVYVTSGASCIGATGLIGSSSNYAVIANNMLVSEDAGTSNMLTTPLNIITADYAKVLFNSVKLIAPSRSGIAAATFGGGVLSNSYFYNNIVGCYDTVNFAFNFIPTEDSVNYIGYNIYYTRSPLLNKYDGVNCLSFSNWLTHNPSDGNSQNVNPAFLSTTNTDLRSYSQNVKSHGVPFAEVNNDIYGTVRDATAPCIGAFEFSSLPYDFEVLEFLEPYNEYCDAPTGAPLRVVIKNSGINAYVPSEQTIPMQLVYSRGTTPGVMTPGVSGSIPVNITIPASDTITWNTGVTIPFPTVGLDDTTYTLYTWLISTIDPNPANDTSMTTVMSHYHYPAPNNVNVNSNYGVPATVTVTQGLQTWYSNVYTSGANHKSEVYWYTSPESTEPIWRGSTFTTDPLYSDTTLYIRQRRDYPLVKITEVQLKQNQPGVTYPMPMWIHSSTNLAVELTNIGDYPANLFGDTLMTVSNTSSLNNKNYVFPNLTIQPGKTLVVQFRTGINNVDSTRTVGTSATLNPNQTANFALIYNHQGVYEDAVAFNDITSQTNWTNKNVPNTVWSGEGIQLPDSIPTAGVYRTSWTNNATTVTSSASRWMRATNDHRMTIGTTNQNLIRFVDNGCEGDVASVNIHLINLPNVDIAVEDLELNDGCGMGTNPITVNVFNRGAQPSGQLILNYKIQGHPQYEGQAQSLQVCSDTIAAGLASQASIVHTFSQVPDFSVASASVDFDVLVWAQKNNNDNTSFNDTISMEVTSMFTPGAPNVNQYDTVTYDGIMHLTSLTPPLDSLAWYDRNMMPLDTVNTYVTNHMYEDDTFYVTSFGAKINQYHIGELTSLSAANGYPSPYNPNKKYVKEQYLYTAEDLIAAGHSAGPIITVSFYLDTVHGAGEFTLTDYVLSMGTTTQQTFSANNNWLDVTELCHVDSLYLNNSKKGWVSFTLDSAFMWNGTDNIVVQITRTCDPNVTSGARTRYTAAGNNNRVLYKNDNSNDLTNFTANGARSANRPDVRFGFVDYGCEGPSAPIYVTVINIPAADASLQFEVGDGGTASGFNSCDTTNVNVVLRNMGGMPFSSYQIDYWIDTLHGVYTGTTEIQPRTNSTLTIAHHLFTPGRHSLRVAVTLPGDTVQSNDTISRTLNVRFCAGTYPIGANGLYADFTTAIDTLHNAGVDGAVIFAVEPGTYVEQLTIGAVDGVSSTNTVSFQGLASNPDTVVLRFAPTANDNYVLNLENASFIEFKDMTILSRGAGNYSNVVNISQSNQIRFTNAVIRVKGGLNNVNASGIIVGEGVTALYITNSTLDSGYYAVRSQVSQMGASSGMYLSGNTIQNFFNTGIYFRKCDDVYLVANTVRTGASSNGKALIGVLIAQHTGPTTIERNNVVLSDNFNGGKQGIKLIDVNSSNATRSIVSNNMCAMNGTRSTGLTSSGIWIDSSTWINVYYNTCNVYAGNDAQGAQTRSMYVGTTSMEVYIMNNIFQNMSAGYAYYVNNPMNVGNSNYNDYYSSAEDRLAYWGGSELPTIDTLRHTNQMDAQSMNDRAYFESNEDLHLTLGTFCERAQYNTMVPLDIDGYIRPQIPSPCMGAHEFLRKSHNIAIVDIRKPKIKEYPTQSRGFTDNVESDTLVVLVEFMNDGTSTESNLQWWAEVKNTTLSSSHRVISELLPQGRAVDSNYIVMPIGIIDTQIVVVHFPMANDSLPANNIMEQVFFLDPAYNFMAEKVMILDTGCRLQSTPVGIKLKNVGRKAFPQGWQVPVGFQAVLQTANVTVSTLPVQWTETLTLPSACDTNESVTLNFATPANLYPTGIDKDIVVRARAWVSHQYDQKPMNDTTNFVNHNSYYTPNMPVGTDLHIPYATWDTIFASQTDLPPGANPIHRPIRWHIDSIGTAADEPFYAPNNYAASCWWETPQYFRDTVYYLSCISAHAGNAALTCTSYYNPVHVYINPRVPVDMAVLDVVEPVGNRVYMNRDSVKISLINYGTQTLSNIPVVYQLFDHTNTLLQEVHESCSQSIAPDQVYVYTFDSLLSIPAWSTTNAYHLRVWTDMPNENVRLNDTLRNLSYFYAVPDNVYEAVELFNKPGLDITRVAFSSLDNKVSAAGHTYINFVNASRGLGAISTPETIDTIVLKDYGGSVEPQALGELRALHLVKGTVDTMIVEAVAGDKTDDRDTKGWLSVWIDADRDGSFRWNPVNPNTDSADYGYPNCEIIYHDTIQSSVPKSFLFTLPEDIRTGYMRMRVIVEQGSYHPSEPNASFPFGSVHDYLLYIEDRPENDYDLCASRIVSPREQHIGGHTGYGSDTIQVAVKFQITNKGYQPINSVNIEYTYSGGDGVNTDNLPWTGSLLPGQSAEIELPARVFAVGVTDVIIVAKAPGDTITFNDTLMYQYYRAPIKSLIWQDDFEGNDEWFIPRGYNVFSQNLWQRGRSRKPNIMACVSDSSVLATNINGVVSAYTTGNVSYAYTPIYDISVIRPDTLEIWVARGMTTGHFLRLEYYNYEGKWTIVGSASDPEWYNSSLGWDTVSSGYGYNLCRFALSAIGSDFLQRLQFRLVYKSETESGSCDGAAIDNFVIGRMRRPIDLSVIAITYPIEPRFGDVVNPRVVIKNNGMDVMNDFTLAYLPYGVHLARTGTFHSETGILPGQTAVYEFPTPFVIMDDFPDTFQICAFTTVQMDMYRDNDTVCQDFYLAPMENDMGAVTFMSPLDHIVAGDSVEVTVRIRNFGLSPVSGCTLTYIYNETFEVTENLNFADYLGHDLGTFEYFNYSFRQKFRASMGVMNLLSYVKMTGDNYPYNDTISKRLEGLSAITDLRAREIIVDSSDHNVYFMQVVVDNVGARAANDFKIGYWYYNDLSTYRETIYHSDVPLPALSTLYYVFPDSLPNQLSLYSRVTAFVYADDDNDRTNDTTNVIGEQFVDFHPVRVLVEENRYDSCKVRIEIENVGNVVTNPTRYFNVTAVINGTQVKKNMNFMAVRPGESVFIDFPNKVPKSPTRSYVGTGTISGASDDHNPSNNQTSRIEVVNYLDLPLVEESNGIVLEQNYPNPYNTSTRIDFFLPTGGEVRFFVMDELGRLVYQTVKDYSAGDQSINFSQNGMTSGVYYYGIEVGGERLMRKMVFKK